MTGPWSRSLACAVDEAAAVHGLGLRRRFGVFAVFAVFAVSAHEARGLLSLRGWRWR